MLTLREQFRAAYELQRQDRLGDAERVYREILLRDPHCAAAWRGLGIVQHMSARHEDAIDSLKKAVALEPDSVGFRSNLAALLGSVGRHEEAATLLERTLEANPNFLEGWSNLAVACEKQSKYEQAAGACRECLRIRPEYAPAYAHLGRLLERQGKLVAAATSSDAALRLEPDRQDALRLSAHLHSELGDLPAVLHNLRRLKELLPDSSAVHSSLVYNLHYDDQLGPQELFDEHLAWARRHADPLRPLWRPHDNDRSPGRRLRVGYVSPDLREHTVTRFISAAIEHHDREQFEVICYSNSPREDATSHRLKAAATQWRHIDGLNDDRAAQLIRDDKIDILVDLRGHGLHNRLTLFARKPAPVQATMVGYFNGTGMSAMDYRITDQWQDPPGESEQYHVERLTRLPTGCWCYTADEDAPQVVPPPALARGHVTFGSLNKILKVSPRCAKTWAALLDAVPGSRLLLVAPGVDASDHVRESLVRWGIPTDRLIIVGKAAPRADYLRRLEQVDICLDPFPFNGITTTCDSLWMGAPVVTLNGRTSVSRAGRSILSAAGLGELVAQTELEFVQLASNLARDLDRLCELRDEMRQRLRSSSLLNHRAFAGALDAAFRQMWQGFCASSR
jgi:predicted O-linked N-acetylglucosamine transferase (SPINDLY family)